MYLQAQRRQTSVAASIPAVGEYFAATSRKCDC
jgi:hypothetical protein